MAQNSKKPKLINKIVHTKFSNMPT
eukprot:UN16556